MLHSGAKKALEVKSDSLHRERAGFGSGIALYLLGGGGGGVFW